MPKVRPLTAAEKVDRELGGIFLSHLNLMGEKPTGKAFSEVANFAEQPGRRKLAQPSQMKVWELMQTVTALHISPDELITALYGR